MPLTQKGEKIMAAMKEQYGERGEEVFYAAKNKGTITGVDSAEPEEDCADQPVVVPPAAMPMGGDQTPVTPPMPMPDTEHPQLHPDASAPPEPALGDAGFGIRDASVGYGGVAGGVIPQDWGSDQAPLVADLLPQGGMSLADIVRAGEGFWRQWGSS
jgi:hypothetical protein